jgi:hypothetical protein
MAFIFYLAEKTGPIVNPINKLLETIMQIIAPVKSAALKVKKNVEDNKPAYVLGAVAIMAIALQQKNRVDFNNFLIEKDIDPEEYYCPESYEEKMNS